MEIISRDRWGARYERGFTWAPLPAPEVWLHHSVTVAPDLVWIDADRDGVEDDEEKAMRLLEEIGQSRFGGGISYTWLIMPSGRIYEGHGVDRQGSHTGGRNDRARAICFVGNYDVEPPTTAQVRSAAWLLQEGRRRGWLTQARLNGGHRDLKQTACPGAFAYALVDDINRLAAGQPVTDQVEKEKDMASAVLAHGDDRNAMRPGGKYAWGDAVFLVKFDPEEAGGAVRRYVGGPLVARMIAALGPVQQWRQAELDAVATVEGGGIPESVIKA